MRPVLVLIPFLLGVAPARAEYRAFKLTITHRLTGTSYSVTSILDDIQFPMYYPVSMNETVTIAETWMCWGRQGEFLAICPNPKPKPLVP